MITLFDTPTLTFDDNGVRDWLNAVNTAALATGLTRSTVTGQIDLNNIVYPVLTGPMNGYYYMPPLIFDYDDGLGDKIRVSIEVGKWRYQPSNSGSTTSYPVYSVLRVNVGRVDPSTNAMRPNSYTTAGWMGQAISITSSTSKLSTDVSERYSVHINGRQSCIIAKAGFVAFILSPAYVQNQTLVQVSTYTLTHTVFAVERSHSSTTGDYTNDYLSYFGRKFSDESGTSNPDHSGSSWHYVGATVGTNPMIYSSMNVLYPTSSIVKGGELFNIIKTNKSGSHDNTFKNAFTINQFIAGNMQLIKVNVDGVVKDAVCLANSVSIYQGPSYDTVFVG